MASINNRWHKVKLSSFCDVIMGQSPPSSTYNEEGKGLPFFQGVKDFGRIYPSKRVYCTANTRKIAEADDVLLSVRAPVGEVNIASERCIIGRGIAALRVKTRNKNDQRFLYYLMLFNKKIWRQLHSGTTFEEITREDIENLEVFIPKNILERHKIAEILGSLDDKIELNYEMNKTLEAIAQAIFENWFVAFEPFKDKLIYNKELGRKIPKEWEVREISEFFDMVKGRKCDLLEKCGDNSEGCLPYLTIETFEEGAVKYWTKEKHPFVEVEDIVLVADGERAGKILRFKMGVLGSTLLMLKQKSGNYDLRNYVFLLLKDMECKLMRHRTGSAVPHLDKGYLANLKIIIPQPLSIIENFNKFVKPIFEKIILNLEEIATLRSIRDALLPRLLSGEIRVKVDVEEEFPEETKKLEDIGRKKAKIQVSLEEWLRRG
jgi:type I restriction enzyme S subunit